GARVFRVGPATGLLRPGAVSGTTQVPVGQTPGPLALRPGPFRYPVELRLWGWHPEPVTLDAAVQPSPVVHLRPRVTLLIPLLYSVRDFPVVYGFGLLGLAFWRALEREHQTRRKAEREELGLALRGLEAGVVLGGYRLGRRLGAGGMAQVFEAFPSDREERVALKVISAGPEPERFLDEVAACCALRHPNLVHLYDWGQQDRYFYLAMELLEGETLAARLARGPLPVKQVLRLGLEVARALQAAHAAGVVHRDLKPENLMLTGRGVKVLDFGVASRAGRTTRTAVGEVTGTLGYVAPEVLQGQPATWRSDLYSLGVVLYTALSGEHPFAGPPEAMVRRQMLEDPPPLADVPEPVARVVGRLLSRDPEARASEPGHLVGDLTELAGD
ncbi:MAG: serine/threonine-protein kinase, partial [Candidatus Eremiobacterota bacterium]